MHSSLTCLIFWHVLQKEYLLELLCSNQQSVLTTLLVILNLFNSEAFTSYLEKSENALICLISNVQSLIMIATQCSFFNQFDTVSYLLYLFHSPFDLVIQTTLKKLHHARDLTIFNSFDSEASILQISLTTSLF